MKQNKLKYEARRNKLLSQCLISVEVISASSIVDFNIEVDKILPYILESQELRLEPLLGTALYRKLMGGNLSFEYQLLLDNYVVKYLLH